MKLEDCRKLKKGDRIIVSLGRGCTQEMTFIALRNMVTYGRTTIDEFLRNGLGKGRNVVEAEMKYLDDRERITTNYFNLRKLIRKA